MHLLEWLHLVALGDRSSCGFLVTLGGCRHLDGLEQRRRIGTSWWLFVAISRWLWEVCAYLGGVPKATLVDCSCHWATSLVGRFLWCPSEDEVRATTLSHRTTKCWSTQRGRSVPANTWTSGEKLVSQLCLISILPVLDCLYWWLVHPLHDGINISSYLYIPQTSVISLVDYFALCSLVL